MTLLREEFNFETEARFGAERKEALIIVDIQNDFLPGGALAVAGGDEVIQVINGMQREFELIVLTQDWHPSDHLSFYSAHRGKEVFEEVELDGLPQVLWPEHCVQGTRGAAFSDELGSNRASLIIRKGTVREIDSYSAFYDNGRRNSTGLAGYLMEKSVSKVTVCGLAGDYCVFFTAMDALHLGFDVDIRLDATRAIDASGFEKKIGQFTKAGGRVV